MKILLVVWGLTKAIGGRQYAGATLANDMVKRGHECVILTDNHRSSPPVFPLDKAIRVVRVDALDNSWSREKMRRAVLAIAPDVVAVLSSCGDLADWPVLLKGTGIPFVISERGDPFAMGKRWGNNDLRLGVLSTADRIHIQAKGYTSYFPSFFQGRLHVIPNPVYPAQRLAAPAGENVTPKIIINVGRINEAAKQQLLLARSFALIAKDYPDWELHYWGGGHPQEVSALKRLVAELGLQGRIRVCGKTDKVGEKLQSAHVFAFPSKIEGFPNALLEAQAHGLPALGYRHCGGTNEIIRDGVNGLLFERLDEQTIAAELRKLLDDGLRRETMGRAAFENSKRYDAANIFDQYEEMFFKAFRAKGQTRLEAAPETDEESIYRKYVDALHGLEYTQKKKSPPVRPRLLAMLENARKQFSRTYIRPLRDALRRLKEKRG